MPGTVPAVEDQDHADVVIVGAGHNGLVAGAYLARAGLDVCVVEAAPTIGGMTATGRLIPGAPDHLVNPCALDVLFMRGSTVIPDLGLDRFGLRLLDADPAYVYLHPDGASIAIWRDAARTAAEIERFSPADAAAYRRFVTLLQAVMDIGLPFIGADPTHPGARTLARAGRATVRHRRHLGETGDLLTSTGEQVVRERFGHEVVIAALINLAAAAGPVTLEGSGITHLVLAYLHRFGVGRPAGGTGAIPEAIAACLRRAGGRIVTSVPVERIVVAGGRATGVVLEDGRTFHARRAVLTACDPRTALGRLLPPGALSPKMTARVATIPVNSHGTSPMTVHVALSGRLALDRHAARRGDGVDLRVPIALIGTPDDVRHSYRSAAAGFVSDRSFLWGAVPTGVDPSQAPTGQDTFYLYAPAAPLEPLDPGPGGAEHGAKLLLARAAQYYDHLDELEIGRFVETPADIAARTRSTNGSILHVDFALLRSGPLRPAKGLGGYRTPVAGLYITGAGTHPGAGVSGIPGQRAAQRILTDQRHGARR